MPQAQRSWRMMGASGGLTLVLSGCLILLSAGLSWLLISLWVLRVAISTSNRITPADWILVLGRQLLGSSITLDYAARLNRATALAAAQPQARLLVLGGHTSEGPFTEAAQGRNFLLRRGVAADRIRTEDGSRHTLENLQHARSYLGDSAGRIVLVTSRYHLARSRALASALGIRVQLCAAESSFSWSAAAVLSLLLEGFYLHWYWVGRAWVGLTRNEKALARIR